MSDLFLVAHLGDRTIAVRSDDVESVVDVGDIMPVPGAAAAVCGLATLRSRVVTVMQTHALLGLSVPRSATRRAIIVRSEGHHYAMLVDRVDDIAPFAVQPLGPGLSLSGAWAAAGRGVIERDGEVILVLDLAALLAGQMLAAEPVN